MKSDVGSRRRPWTYRAKQSQLPEAGHRGGVSIADCGFRIADWRETCPPARPLRPVESEMCETNPIWSGPILPPGGMTPNKPNSARTAGRPGRWEGQTCETKPIWTGPIPQPDGIAPNKPNLRPSGRHGGLGICQRSLGTPLAGDDTDFIGVVMLKKVG